MERGQSYTLELFFKIPGDVSLRFVVGNVELVHGTTSELIVCLNHAPVMIDIHNNK